MQQLPEFVFIGPNKSGTTWIYDYLRQHERVILPAGVKETFFFDRRFDVRPVAWYSDHFRVRQSSVDATFVEVAPSYFHCAAAPKRMHDLMPAAKLIVSLRDPVDRAWSHYCHLRRYGYTSAGLEQACQEYPQVIEASQYFRMLNRWLEFFPLEQVSFLWQESLSADIDAFSAELCEILGLEEMPPVQRNREKKNASTMPKNRLLAKYARTLADFLRSHRLYFIVNGAKNLGFKSLVFGSGREGKGLAPTVADTDFLRAALCVDFAAFAERYGFTDIPQSVSSRFAK